MPDVALKLLLAIYAELKEHPMTMLAIILLSGAISYNHLEIINTAAVDADQSAAITGAKNSIDRLTQRVAEASNNINELTIANLRTAIITARKQQCQATTPDAKQYFAEELTRLTEQYHTVGGNNFTIPDCSIYK